MDESNSNAIIEIEEDGLSTEIEDCDPPGEIDDVFVSAEIIDTDDLEDMKEKLTLASNDEPDDDTKREAAQKLKHHADGIEQQAEKLSRGRKKALKEDAEKVRETAGYMEDEADAEE